MSQTTKRLLLSADGILIPSLRKYLVVMHYAEYVLRLTAETSTANHFSSSVLLGKVSLFGRTIQLLYNN